MQRFRRLIIVTGAFAAFAIAPRPAMAQCFGDSDTETETCPNCPGYQACVCLYAGHACVDKIICKSRPKPVAQVGYTLTETTTTCYFRTPCASVQGGLCDPIQNPCVETAEVQQEGVMYILTGTALPCDYTSP